MVMLSFLLGVLNQPTCFFNLCDFMMLSQWSVISPNPFSTTLFAHTGWVTPSGALHGAGVLANTKDNLGFARWNRVKSQKTPKSRGQRSASARPHWFFMIPIQKKIFSWMVLVLNLFILHTKDRLNTNSNGLFVKCMGYYTTHTYIWYAPSVQVSAR